MTDFTLQEAENLLKSISEKKQYEKSIMKGKLFLLLDYYYSQFLGINVRYFPSNTAKNLNNETSLKGESRHKLQKFFAPVFPNTTTDETGQIYYIPPKVSKQYAVKSKDNISTSNNFLNKYNSKF